jgi:superfamily I DNA and/or RNA helicase
MSPYEDKIIVVQNVNNNESRFTRGGTRQNEFSAKVIIDILDEYYSKGDFSFSIGIITPYKGQVALLKALLRERNYDNKFLSKIKIGTIHTFQGSECDLILFDIVEARNNGIGKLYSGQEGEQLINVAISRAKHKLIIVGDVNLFTIGAGNAMVSNKVTRIFRTLSYLLN